MKLIILQDSNGNWGHYYYSDMEELRRIISRIENGTLIGYNVTIGDKAQIGRFCTIQDNMVIGSCAVINANFNIDMNVSDGEVLETPSKWERD